MHDAVADVLSERQRLSRSGPAGFLVSLALHGALALGVIAAARSHKPSELRPVLTLKFASARPAAGTTVATPARPAPAPVQPAPREEPKPEPPKVEPPKVEKKPATPVDQSLWGRSEKKPKADPKPAAAATPADTTPSRLPSAPQSGGEGAGSAAGGVPGIGMAGVSGLEGDFPYTIYVDRMLTIIGRNWFRPQTKAEPIVQIYFTIERDGRIRDPKIEKSSGSSVFDRAALRAVIESSPLPPLPFGYSGTELGVHMTFH